MGIDFNQMVRDLKEGKLTKEFYSFVTKEVKNEIQHRRMDFLRYKLNARANSGQKLSKEEVFDIIHDFIDQWLFARSSKGNLINGSVFNVESEVELTRNIKTAFRSFINKGNREADPDAARLNDKVKNILRELSEIFEPKNNIGYTTPSKTSWRLKEGAVYNGNDKYTVTLFDKLSEVDGFVKFSNLVEELKKHFYRRKSEEQISEEYSDDEEYKGIVIPDASALEEIECVEEEVHSLVVIKFLNELTPLQKEIFYLKAIKEHTLGKIADKLELKLGKVNYQLQLAFSKLTEMSNKYGFTEEDNKLVIKKIILYLKNYK